MLNYKNLPQVKEKLKELANVKAANHKASEIFTLTFRQKFANDIPKNKGTITRSNWTRHTVYAMRSTANYLGANCIFETRGRLDGVIETRESKPRTILLAEWEWKYNDVFGKGKELEKLWLGVKKSSPADALLLTYCPLDEYFDFVKKVVQYWQEKSTKKQPSLYLLVLCYGKEGSGLYAKVLRTLQICSNEVIYWDDIT